MPLYNFILPEGSTQSSTERSDGLSGMRQLEGEKNLLTRLVLQTVTPVTELGLLIPLCETGHSFFRVRLTSLCQTENSESLSSGETNSNFKENSIFERKKSHWCSMLKIRYCCCVFGEACIHHKHFALN